MWFSKESMGRNRQNCALTRANGSPQNFFRKDEDRRTEVNVNNTMNNYVLTEKKLMDWQ